MNLNKNINIGVSSNTCKKLYIAYTEMIRTIQVISFITFNKKPK